LRRLSWASSAAALVGCSVAVAGCGGAGVSVSSRVTVYVSMPLRGPSASAGRDVVDGARMALDAAHRRAGELRVRAVYLDDTAGSGGAARWSQARTGANARRATEDTSAVAYIGDFESGASRVSEPITNGAHLLQVSPASTAVDLVRPFPGSNEVPAAEKEGGERTFGRVIPDDVAQAVAAAKWVRRLGIRRVEIVRDHSAFGHILADGFRESLGRTSVTRRRPDWLYYAGLANDELRTLGRSARHHPVMGSSALLQPFRDGAAINAFLATSPAQAPSQLPAVGRRFAARFRGRYGGEPGPYAAYGYEAMAVVLDSIRRAGDKGTNREAVIDAFFATRNRRSILGTYSIDAFGETTLDRLAGYRLSALAPPKPVALLPAR
jgi:branched-chain amino acid transport system substrate-binding protein